MGRYVVIDLEMCKVPKAKRTDKYHWANETIQIGAVLLDEEYNVEDKFMTYVCPEYGELDAYIETLTGIKTANIAKAPNIERALRLFMEWTPKDAVLVAWSHSDEKQIRWEIEGKDIHIEGLEELFGRYIDAQKLFTQKIEGEKNYKLSEALIIADIDYEDGAHDGLTDAYNTALLFAKMQKENVMKLNPFYSMPKTEHLSVSFGELFNDIMTAIT